LFRKVVPLFLSLKGWLQKPEKTAVSFCFCEKLPFVFSQQWKKTLALNK